MEFRNDRSTCARLRSRSLRGAWVLRPLTALPVRGTLRVGRRMPTQPYRELPPSTDKKAPASLACEWRDSERQVQPVGLYYRVALGVMAVGIFWNLSPVIAALIALGVVVSTVWYVQKLNAQRPLKLSVSNGTLFIEAHGAPRVTLPLGDVREVEMDSKAIQRVTYHQNVGAALPSTNVSGDVDVSRIVFVKEDGARVWLTDSYASYSECLERFGKVRVFLRAHGWLPHDEREKAQR